MGSKRLRTMVFLALIVMLGLPLSLEATTVLEQIAWGRCSESESEALPKNLTLIQVVNDKEISKAAGFDILLEAAYLSRFDVTGGGVVVKGKVIKEDGGSTPLPKMIGKMVFGNADDAASSDVSLERGDIIEWKIKFKNLPRLAESQECFALELLISGSEIDR